MVGSNGPLPNDRTHSLKAYGFYLFNRQTTQNIIEQYYRPRNSLRADGGRPISYPDARSTRLSARYDFSL